MQKAFSQFVEKPHSLSIERVGATIGRPPTWRCIAFSGAAFLQDKRARASNARPYKSLSTVFSIATPGMGNNQVARDH